MVATKVGANIHTYIHTYIGLHSLTDYRARMKASIRDPALAKDGRVNGSEVNQLSLRLQETP